MCIMDLPTPGGLEKNFRQSTLWIDIAWVLRSIDFKYTACAEQPKHISC